MTPRRPQPPICVAHHEGCEAQLTSPCLPSQSSISLAMASELASIISMWVLPLIPIVGEIEHVGFAAGCKQRLAIAGDDRDKARPECALVEEVAHTTRCGTFFTRATSTLARSGAPDGSTAISALILSGASSAAVKPEFGLAVHDHDARTDLLHQRIVGAEGRGIVGDPARHALLHELIEGIDGKLHAVVGRATAADFVARPEAEQLPRLLLVGTAARSCRFPDSAPTRRGRVPDRVGDIDVVAGVEDRCCQPHLPSGLVSQVTPVRPPPCQNRIGTLARGCASLTNWTYIWSTSNSPFGSTLRGGEPGVNATSRVGMPVKVA